MLVRDLHGAGSWRPRGRSAECFGRAVCSAGKKPRIPGPGFSTPSPRAMPRAHAIPHALPYPPPPPPRGTLRSPRKEPPLQQQHTRPQMPAGVMCTCYVACSCVPGRGSPAVGPEDRRPREGPHFGGSPVGYFQDDSMNQQPQDQMPRTQMVESL